MEPGAGAASADAAVKPADAAVKPADAAASTVTTDEGVSSTESGSAVQSGWAATAVWAEADAADGTAWWDAAGRLWARICYGSATTAADNAASSADTTIRWTRASQRQSEPWLAAAAATAPRNDC